MTTRTETPNLFGIRLAHRVMLRDMRRLTAAAERIGRGEPCPPDRAEALARWVVQACDEIHHHHTVEDEALIPLLADRAGAEVDLAELSADHHALGPLLDAVRTAAAAVSAAGADRRASAAELGRALARVRDELDEHIGEEERSMFPMVEKYLTVAEWAKVEKRARKGGTPMAVALPRVVDVTEPAEMAELKGAAGPVLMVLLALVRPRYRRRERLVFG